MSLLERAAKLSFTGGVCILQRLKGSCYRQAFWVVTDQPYKNRMLYMFCYSVVWLLSKPVCYYPYSFHTRLKILHEYLRTPRC